MHGSAITQVEQTTSQLTSIHESYRTLHGGDWFQARINNIKHNNIGSRESEHAWSRLATPDHESNLQKLRNWCSLETVVSICTETQALSHDSLASTDRGSAEENPKQWPYYAADTLALLQQLASPCKMPVSSQQLWKIVKYVDSFCEHCHFSYIWATRF